MKRIVLVLTLLIGLGCAQPAHAGFFADKKAEFIQNRAVKAEKKAVKKTLTLQEKYAAKYDLISLSSLYHQDFVSSDGFKKDIYFDLIKDSWKSYPDIVYTSEITDIRIENSEAEVDVKETSIATSTQLEDGVKLHGELNSLSEGTYYLKKVDDQWLIIGEKVNNEKSFLKYGDTRFVEMDLTSPQTAKAGEYYTSTLEIKKPENAFIVASICQDNITYPQEKVQEVFRNLPDDNILERMFIANKLGKNEYNVATIGMSKSRIVGFDKIQVYMAGVAFIMTRVNIEEQDAKKD